MFTDIHALAPNLVVIEGRHPTLLWEACDVPSIVVYRGTKTLYVLDTGVGPEQRAALEAQVAKHGEGAEEIVLAETVRKEFAANPEGLTVDALYDAQDIPSTSYVSFLIAIQFPVFTTFTKLTLLNHLLLYNFPSRRETDGKVRFLTK